MKAHLLAAIIGAGFLASSVTTFAADGSAILQSQCASCHALTQPEKVTLDHIWERKGPDLYYAGVKFNKPWLVKWLQDPVRIRPSGVFYRTHIKKGEKADVVDESTLIDHMKLTQADAEAAADALMALTGPEGLIETGKFDKDKKASPMAKMLFVKLRGCSACHSTGDGKGGLSGPELQTAGERLQPDFIYSYTKDPQKIDKGVWMPKLAISEQDLQNLTSYIVQLSGKKEAK
ncbi:cytochrome c [Nitrosomonas sp. HPC101]|nr:cytochrome c [Nitrosomonas sp. HPC101]